MACIEVVATRIGKGIIASAQLATEAVKASLALVGERVSASAQLATKPATIVAADLGSHIRAECSIICSLNQIYEWLRVTPAEIQWITDDQGVFFDVDTNTEWRVYVD